MKFDVIYLNKEIKKNFKDPRLPHENVKITPLGTRLLNSATKEVLAILHFHKDAKIKLSEGKIISVIDSLKASSTMKDPNFMDELLAHINFFINYAKIKNETGYLILTRRPSNYPEKYFIDKYFVYTDKVPSESGDLVEKPVLPDNSQLYICNNGHNDYEIKLFPDHYELKGNPKGSRGQKIELFSELKNNLSDAPIEVKKSFNNLLQYFSSLED